MGSTGDPPVPVGDSPTGSENDGLLSWRNALGNITLELPPGQWPGGTGESPVPPIPRSNMAWREPGPASGAFSRILRFELRFDELYNPPMLDIKLIREKPDLVRQRLATRAGDEAKIDLVLSLDEQRRKLLADVEATEGRPQSRFQGDRRADGAEESAGSRSQEG